MSAFTRMQQALRPLNLYRLDGSTMVDAELAAYAVGLDLLEELLDAIYREAFVITAQEEGLRWRESLLAGDREGLSLEIRRELLLRREAITVNSKTREEIEAALYSCGLRCALEELPDGAVKVRCLEALLPFADRQEMEAAAMEVLPAHAQISFDFSALEA